MLNIENLRNLGVRVATKSALILAAGGTGVGGAALVGGDPAVGAVVSGGLASVLILSRDILYSGPEDYQNINKALRIKQGQDKPQAQP